jgi:hypothetical protein
MATKGGGALAPDTKEANRALAPAAQRALEEAAARRGHEVAARPREFRGRDGPDPVRYGDWEVKGIASDF